MKLTVTMIVGFVLTLSAGVRAQDQRVTLEVKDRTFREVLAELKRQTGLDFFYSMDEVDAGRRVTLTAREERVDDVLRRLLGEGFAWEYLEGMVVIKPAPEGESDEEPKAVEVKGFVYDEKRQPMPGVTVQVVGTTVGTATDIKGWFRIDLPLENGELIFSFIGYKDKRLTFSRETTNDTLRVYMEVEAEALDEVVVTGYQRLQEKAMAGSYARVDADELFSTGNETIEQMLQGRLPGVMVQNLSGLTGTRQKVRVRGTSTLLGNADPVWVVDGIIQQDNLPFEASQLANISDDNLDMMKDFIGGAISWLNPNDIEDITVLKDASATAIYGVKAANGVIVITTKKGERGRLSLNYTGNFSVSTRLNYNRMEIMNSKERVDLSREAFERGVRVADEDIGYMGLALAYARREISLEEFHAGVRKLETVNTDWFDILYQTPFSHNHSVSFSGGDDRATYRASFGYRNTLNTAKGNEQETFTANLNMSAIFWDRLTMNATLSGFYSKTQAFASGVDPYGYAIQTSRVISCFNDDGSLFFYDKNGDDYNILHELANSGNENTLKSMNVNLSLRWKFSDYLVLSGVFGGSTSVSEAETWFTEYSHKITGIRGYEYGAYMATDQAFQNSVLPYGGLLSLSESHNLNYTTRLQLEYVNLVNGVHSLNFVGGIELQSSKYDGYSQDNYGYMPDRGLSFTNVPLTYWTDNKENTRYARTEPTVTDKLSNYVSYYITGSYMYDERYSVNLSLRGDASNRFGDKSKFQNVWAAGLRWNVLEESWMQNQNIVNELSFMASFGYQGNVVEGVSPDFIARMEDVDSETGEFTMTWTQLPNPALKPEKTLSVNLGLNFALFKNKINGTFNWYYKKTSDVITTASIPYENGTTSMSVNEGDMTNRGWDLAFSVVPIRTKNFMWSLGTSFSGNENKINSKLEETQDWEDAVSGNFNKEGYPVGSFWAFRFTGLDHEEGFPMFDLTKTDGEAVDDATAYMEYMGTIEPKFTVGINMMFRWKRFSFPLNFYVSRGNYMFLDSPYESGYMMLSEYENASTQLNDRWRKPGDEALTDIPSIPTPRGIQEISVAGKDVYPLVAWGYSNARVVNAWYIRFNDLQFSYNLPEEWISGFARSVILSFSATNPLQLKSKDFEGRDPEVAMGQQPRSQSFSFGIRIGF